MNILTTIPTWFDSNRFDFSFEFHWIECMHWTALHFIASAFAINITARDQKGQFTCYTHMCNMENKKSFNRFATWDSRTEILKSQVQRSIKDFSQVLVCVVVKDCKLGHIQISYCKCTQSGQKWYAHTYNYKSIDLVGNWSKWKPITPYRNTQFSQTILNEFWCEVGQHQFRNERLKLRHKIQRARERMILRTKECEICSQRERTHSFLFCHSLSPLPFDRHFLITYFPVALWEIAFATIKPSEWMKKITDDQVQYHRYVYA